MQELLIKHCKWWRFRRVIRTAGAGLGAGDLLGPRNRSSVCRPGASFLPLQAVQPGLQQRNLRFLYPQFPYLTRQLLDFRLLRLVLFATGCIAVPRSLISLLLADDLPAPLSYSLTSCPRLFLPEHEGNLNDPIRVCQSPLDPFALLL